MKPPTPTQTQRLLALPLEWRRALCGAAMEEPGWRIREDRPPSLRAHATPEHIERGWAFAPCCGLAWLRAPGTGFRIGGPPWVAWRPGSLMELEPVDAFLAYAEANDMP